MNLFNSFQAVAFYTMLPLAAQWLFENDKDVWGYLTCIVCLVGYVLISFAVNEQSK